MCSRWSVRARSRRPPSGRCSTRWTKARRTRFGEEWAHCRRQAASSPEQSCRFGTSVAGLSLRFAAQTSPCAANPMPGCGRDYGCSAPWHACRTVSIRLPDEGRPLIDDSDELRWLKDQQPHVDPPAAEATGWARTSSRARPAVVGAGVPRLATQARGRGVRPATERRRGETRSPLAGRGRRGGSAGRGRHRGHRHRRPARRLRPARPGAGVGRRPDPGPRGADRSAAHRRRHARFAHQRPHRRTRHEHPPRASPARTFIWTTAATTTHRRSRGFLRESRPARSTTRSRP